MRAAQLLAVASCLVTFVSAQTPPGFNLTTNVNLPMKFGSQSVGAGDDLPLAEPGHKPTIGLPKSLSAQDTYIINMIDPDVPTQAHPSSISELLHWLQPDVKFPHGTAANSSRPIASYLAPAPPGADKHRYIVLLFKQTGAFHMPKDLSGFNDNNRTGFDALRFSRELGLGQPVAATWFISQNDTATS